MSRREIDFDRAIEDAHKALAYLEANGRTALQRGREAARIDGIHAATLNGGGGEACNCDVEDLEQGADCPHGSPVERAALATPLADPIGMSVRHMVAQVRAMADAGIFAMQACHRVVNVAAPPDPDDGCVTHAKYKRYATAEKAGRCRWCYERREDHNGAGPTREELVAHDEGPVYGRRVKRQRAS